MNTTRTFARSTRTRLGAGVLALAAAMSLGAAGQAQAIGTDVNGGRIHWNVYPCSDGASGTSVNATILYDVRGGLARGRVRGIGGGGVAARPTATDEAQRHEEAEGEATPVTPGAGTGLIGGGRTVDHGAIVDPGAPDHQDRKSRARRGVALPGRPRRGWG